MSALGSIVSSACGVLLIALAARDIFDSIFHPEGRGTLAGATMRAVWVAFRRLGVGPRRRTLAGPLALLTVIATWAALLVLGWALVYWAHVPEGFRFGSGGASDVGFVDALNISLVTLTTLGFGDVTPAAGWLRVVLPLEALLGFGLLSASIAWLLQMYPALQRRQSLAYEVSLLHQAEREAGVSLDRVEPEAAERMYGDLASRLVAVERDLVSFPITYYFAETDERFSLPAVAPYLHELAQRGAQGEKPDGMQLRARLLLESVDDLAATTAKLFHGFHSDRTIDVLEAYARDHGRA